MFRLPLYFVLFMFCTLTALAGGDPDEFGEAEQAGPPQSSPAAVRSHDSNQPDKPRLVNKIDLYASDKAAQILVEGDGELINITQGRIRLGFLFNEERDNIFMGGVVLDGSSELLPAVTLSIGGKAYAGLLGVENVDVVGFSVGIEVEFDPDMEHLPLIFNSSVYYAPDIFTFGQSDRIIDWRVDVGLKVRKSLMAFVGLRFLQFDTRPGDREVDDKVHVGLRWHFR